MKKFLNKSLVLASVLSASTNALASDVNLEKKVSDKTLMEVVQNHSQKQLFVLTPRKQNANFLFAAHGSHQSHQSHGSHASHQSHQSHYSGY